MFVRSLPVLLSFILFGACHAQPALHAPYLFDAPDDSFVLPDILKEISGLGMFPDGTLAAIQDENGILFRIDDRTGNILEDIRFGLDRDYEGVEIADRTAWVLESDGDLFYFPLDDPGNLSRIPTGLSRKHNTEGLGRDLDGHLLIAAKNYPGRDYDTDHERTIWSFNPESGYMSSRARYVIDEQAVDPEGEEKKRIEDVNPSAVAVHPFTGHLYVLSTKKNELYVLTREMSLVERVEFDLEGMVQPEGIVFSDAGTLFISSEGHDLPAHIFVFHQR